MYRSRHGCIEYPGVPPAKRRANAERSAGLRPAVLNAGGTPAAQSILHQPARIGYNTGNEIVTKSVLFL